MRTFHSPNLLIIPTHAHAETLPFAIKSAQNQTVENVDIVIIGDGVTDETREAVTPFLSDSRIHFFDNPKGERHGEEYRDTVIRNSDAEVVTYLGDDDVLFPEHLQLMKSAIVGVDFVNPLPIFINVDGTLDLIPTNLENADSLKWHLDKSVHRNSVSLTGVMHTAESYLRLPCGWRPAPLGRWTDHYMWEQYFALPDFRARTLPYSTTGKFSASQRTTMDPGNRAREIRTLYEQTTQPGFQEQWNGRVSEVVRGKAEQLFVRLHSLELETAQLRIQQTALIEANAHIIDENSSIAGKLNTLIHSKSWRITAPLRKFTSLLIELRRWLASFSK